MKYLIVVVLSALLIWYAPHINNSAKETPQQPSQTDAPKTVRPLQTTTARPKATLAVISPHEALMIRAGIPQSDWSAVNYIVSHESSWRPTARNASSGAYGLCQSLPASKMASAGSDYISNPVTQLRWCHKYAVSRYGGWWHSFAHWKAERWW